MRRRKFGNKYYYFLHGVKTKQSANAQAKQLRAEKGLGVRIVYSDGYYYLYTTSSAGWRPNK